MVKEGRQLLRIERRLPYSSESASCKP